MPDPNRDYIAEAAAECWLDDWTREEAGRRWGPRKSGAGFEAHFIQGKIIDYRWGLTRQELKHTLSFLENRG